MVYSGFVSGSVWYQHLDCCLHALLAWFFCLKWLSHRHRRHGFLAIVHDIVAACLAGGIRRMSERIDETENANGSNGLLPNRDALGRTNADSIHDSASRETTANEDSGTVDASGIVVPKRHAAMRVVSIDDDENANGNPTHDGMKPIGETHNIAQDAVSGMKPRRRVRTKQAIGDGSSEPGGKIERTVASRNRGVMQGSQYADSTTSDEKGTASYASQSSMASDTPDGMHYDAASAVRNVLTDDTSSEMMHDGMVPSTERTDALSMATADVAHDDALRHAPTKTGGDDDAPEAGRAQHHATLRGTHDDDARNVDDENGTPISPDVTRHGMKTVSAPSNGDISGDSGKPNAVSGTRHTRIVSVPPFMSTTMGMGVAGSDAGTTGRRHHRHIDVTERPDDNGTGAQGVNGADAADAVAYGMRADDERTTVMRDEEQPTKLINRPAGDAPNRMHDEVATAYGMSGVIPPIPPVPPIDGQAHNGGRGNSTPRKDARKRNIIIVAVIAVVLVVIGVVYGVGVSRYQSRLFPNTEIGGIDVSEMTAKEAAKATDTSGWHITIDDVTGDTVKIGQDEAGMSVSGASPSDMIAAQDAFAWPLHVIGGSGRSVDRTVSFDYDKLEQTLASLDMCDESKRTAATDASFRYDQGTGKWYVTPDAQGTVVDKDRLFAAVKKSLDGFNSPTVKVTQDMCVQPSVTASDESLNSAVADANKWVSASVTYDIDDQQSAVTVDSKVIVPWVSIARGDDGRFAATLDERAVKAYLARIGDKYDTNGEPLTITTPTGKVASVAGTGEDTGWLTDEGAEFPKLMSDIKGGRTDHREFSMKHRANAKAGSDVWGTTYIEVDLSSQHLWYVKDGKVSVDLGIISGKAGYDTPQGVTAVYKKVTNVTLISPWKDPKTGEPTYKTPIDVGLVISRDGNILIHSAPWQPSGMFGNASYHVSGGSHGCVNAPTDKTWDLYNTVPLNTPVVVHA